MKSVPTRSAYCADSKRESGSSAGHEAAALQAPRSAPAGWRPEGDALQRVAEVVCEL